MDAIRVGTSALCETLLTQGDKNGLALESEGAIRLAIPRVIIF